MSIFFIYFSTFFFIENSTFFFYCSVVLNHYTGFTIFFLFELTIMEYRTVALEQFWNIELLHWIWFISNVDISISLLLICLF